jgi:1-phosphofructokinase family hexose kinase
MSRRAPAPRIVTATLNTALDVTLAIDALHTGAKQPVRSEHVQAGGKGVNVARGLARLGVPSLALVVLGGDTGEQIRASLTRDGLPALALAARGESRTCLELVEPDGRATQLHGAGIDGSGDLGDRAVAALAELPASVEWFALCGSLPPGMPARTARALLEAARQRGLQTAVDIRGPALREAAKAAPDLLRVNAEEFEELSPAAPERWLRDGADRPELVIVSRGAAPFEAATSRGERWQVQPPALEAVNPIGCGDAMMAGWLAAKLAGASLEETLRQATALAAAEALSPVAGQPDPALARRLSAQVTLERL